jgi:predicted deacylase
MNPSAAGDIAGVWSVGADAPGPHVAITGLVHGDEPCGRFAIEKLRAAGIAPARGRLSLALINLGAEAEQRRYLDRDMNRLWSDADIEADRTSREAARARELRSWLATVDLLLDLHTTAFARRPFFVLADMPKTRALADAMAWPDAQQLMPGGCAEGRHLIDYGRFSDEVGPAAVVVECGRHGDAAADEVALRAAKRFLSVTGVAKIADAPEPAPQIERFRIGPPCIARHDDFRPLIPLGGFVDVAAGEIVATDGGQPVRAPFAAVVLSPRPAPPAGTIAFYWCHRLQEDEE